MNFKNLIIALFLGGAVAYGAGNTHPNSLFFSNTNGSGVLNFNTSGTITVPNVTGTLATTSSANFANATFTGTTTFPNSSSLDGSGNELLGGTLGVTGVATFTAEPIVSSLTASLPVFSDGSKGLVSNAMTGTGSVVMSVSPTLTTPALGTPSALVGTNISGTAASLTSGHVTTNANLTGPITSSGNATSIAAQTGTGTTFVMQASPTLTTPNLGTPSAGVMTSVTGLPLTSGVTGTLPILNGGTNATTVTVVPAASSWAGWDANSNFSANNHIPGYATIATGGTTTTLTVSSAYEQDFTGSSTQTVKLPVVATGPLPLGFPFKIVNFSSGAVTVQSSGGNTLQAMAQNTQLIATSIAQSGTGTAAWNWTYQSVQNSLSGGGTVTSVTFTGDGTILSSTPSSAVTTTGTLTAALKTQTARTFLQGPLSGAAANPTFAALTAPTVQKILSTGTQTGWLFTISTSTTCAVGDTYTNNGNTYTAQGALSAQSGTVLFMSGTGATSGTTLTRSSGAGTASITFSTTLATATYTAPASPAPLFIWVRGVGGGGGGTTSGTTAGGTIATAGTATYFGPNLLSGGGGGAAGFSGNGGTGGSASTGTVLGIAQSGNPGAGSSKSSTTAGGSFSGSNGGSSPFGGAGNGGVPTGATGGAAATNSGSGGGGGSNTTSASTWSGGGGGAGGYFDALIVSPSATYPYAIGAAGGGESAGTGGFGGGAGGTGYLIIEEFPQ